MSLVSFAPGFIYGIIAIVHTNVAVGYETVIVLLIKNIFYCAAFYLRYESLRKFGPFVGALMLGTQPIVVFAFGLIFLGEHLTSIQNASMILVAVALFLLASGRNNFENRISATDFGKYYLFPTVASASAIVFDRFFLNGKLQSHDYFVLDRLTVLPTFFIVIAATSVGKVRHDLAAILSLYREVIARNWKGLFLIAIFFTVSAYAYNTALSMEKAAVVGLFRNMAYPIAAFTGVMFFQHKPSTKQWLSFSLVLLAIFCGALQTP